MTPKEKEKNKNLFDPESERAVRGMNWESLFVSIVKESHEPVNVREYFENKGCTDYYELCKYEHKFGDYFVDTPELVIHFECVTVPKDYKGWFPERKVITYGNSEFPDCTKEHDYWFAFLITEDGTEGETIFVHKNVWQTYAKKLPKANQSGKLFRMFSAWNLKNLRSKKWDVKEILYA